MNNLTHAQPPLRSPRSEPAPPPAHEARAGQLTGWVQPRAQLTELARDQMYALLRTYFANTSRRQFEDDLAEKESVILLADARSGELQGFSTLMQLRATVHGQPVVAFFSGDTIIRRDYWGETVLPRLWAQHVFGLAESAGHVRAYWFLISSGYKTYRFLPVFFRSFFPTYRQRTPPEHKELLDTFGALKFGQQYDPASGVVRLAEATPLRAGVAALTERRLQDPHVAFFAAANPGHHAGHELACLVEITRANLTAAGRRMVGAGEDEA